MKTYIFDIDGTLANGEHRIHLLKEKGPDRHSRYYATAEKDEPIAEIVDVLKALAPLHRIIFLTGRPESIREKTEQWLATHCIAPTTLLMRATGDFRQDYIIKQEHFISLPSDIRESVVAVFEDRQQCVDMWRRIGVRCFQVDPGNF